MAANVLSVWASVKTYAFGVYFKPLQEEFGWKIEKVPGFWMDYWLIQTDQSTRSVCLFDLASTAE